tara:strand:+ start:384 stop:881 length:498 start_codon:yes stop_codon:yes gene_type:complete
MKIPPKIFFFCKHFGTGVLIATAFVHVGTLHSSTEPTLIFFQLIPTAFQSLNDPCLPDLLIVQYPAMPGVIMMASLFALFVIEMVLKSKTGGHSHGGPTGQGLDGHGHGGHVHGQGLAAKGAPPGVSTPPQYQNDQQWRDDEYPDEKDLSYVRYCNNHLTQFEPH